MFGGKRFLAVIPARGGSKGIKDKNLKKFCGKPLIYWSIKTAQKSGVFDRIIVNSDSSEILALAEKYGAEPQQRPAELADDKALVADAMVDCLHRLDCKYDYVQLIQATSPGLRPLQIKCAAQFILDKNADFVIGMHEFRDPTIVVKPIPPDLCVTGWYPEKFKNKNRQDLPAAYRVNGYIYLGKWEVWAKRKDYWKTKIYAFICDTYDDIDIDTKYDWEIAEARFKALKRWRL